MDNISMRSYITVNIGKTSYWICIINLLTKVSEFFICARKIIKFLFYSRIFFCISY